MLDRVKKDIQDSIAVKQLVLSTQSEAITKAAQAIVECYQKNKKTLFFGNGGSAADSQHIAAEFVGRYEKERRSIPSIALTTDTSILTAVGNDYGYDRIFERQIEGLGQSGDVAVGISTSGNSKNVLLGLQKAKSMGLTTIALLGKDGGATKSIADISIIVPSQKTARIQECHIMIGHILCERVDESI